MRRGIAPGHVVELIDSLHRHAETISRRLVGTSSMTSGSPISTPRHRMRDGPRSPSRSPACGRLADRRPARCSRTRWAARSTARSETPRSACPSANTEHAPPATTFRLSLAGNYGPQRVDFPLTLPKNRADDGHMTPSMGVESQAAVHAARAASAPESGMFRAGVARGVLVLYAVCTVASAALLAGSGPLRWSEIAPALALHRYSWARYSV